MTIVVQTPSSPALARRGRTTVQNTSQREKSHRREKSRRDWAGARRALRKLMADKNDTVQVFEIMRALNAGEGEKNYYRLLRTPNGGRIAFQHVELAERLTDRAWIDSFAPGTVGGAYRDFLDRTGYSAAGLAEISRVGVEEIDEPNPFSWFGRRMRDTHDLWHVLTGYKAEEHIGEASLVAFSFAQTGGLGWAAIAVAVWLQTLKLGLFNPQATAIWEGYRLGRHAAWLPGEDYEALMTEPLEDARARLRIGRPVRYFAIPDVQRSQGLGAHAKTGVADLVGATA